MRAESTMTEEVIMNIKIAVVSLLIFLGGCSSLARVGLGGGMYVTDRDISFAVHDAWNGMEGSTYEGLNGDGVLVQYTPVSQKYTDRAHLRRFSAMRVEDCRRRNRDAPGRYYSHQGRCAPRYMEVVCRDILRTEWDTEDARKAYRRTYAVCQLPSGEREWIPLSTTEQLDWTARQGRYRRY
ncbi:MAG: hypothetical protein WD003_02120 [Candidatus Paceibacterota bacterium]